MLRHTYAEDLESILEFIYQGEAQVRTKINTQSYQLLLENFKLQWMSEYITTKIQTTPKTKVKGIQISGNFLVI